VNQQFFYLKNVNYKDCHALIYFIFQAIIFHKIVSVHTLNGSTVLVIHTLKLTEIYLKINYFYQCELTVYYLKLL